MTAPQIGYWVRRTGQRWHLAESIVAGDVVTRCGRRMADKAAAPFHVSEVMPLTRAIGQPQLCRQCHPTWEVSGVIPLSEDNPAVSHEPVEG